MSRFLPRLFSIIALTLLAASAHAESIDTGRMPTAVLPSRPTTTCRALWFGVNSVGEILRFSGLGVNVVQSNNPADVTAANLANYNVLVVAFKGSGVIGASQPDIEAWVRAGGALLIHQPGANNAVLDYTPTGFEVTITSGEWCNYPDTASAHSHIVNSGHPITAGLTDADPSGAFDLVGGIGAGYTVLAVNAACGDPALAAGTLGNGRIVFEDGLASSPLFRGTDHYWGNVLNWLCNGAPVPAEETTWGRVKSTYRK